MSRLLVKNLPASINESRLQSVFAKWGTVTDCSLKYTPEGVFRKFAFIGFKADTEAAAAIKALNQSFIDTTKIQVVYANDLTALHKTPTKPNDSKKNGRKKSSTKKKKKDENSKKEGKEETEETEEHKPKQLSDADFLKSKTSAALSDDDSSSASDDDEREDDDNDTLNTEIKKFSVGDKDNKETQKLYKVILRGAPSNLKKSQIEEFFRPIELADVSIPRKLRSKKGSTTGIISVTLKSAADADAAMRRNKNFIGSKKIFLNLIKETIKAGSKDEKQVQQYRPEEDPAKNASLIAETSRIFIRNLAYCCTESDLEQLFAKYGPDIEVQLPIDRLTKKIKGYAIVSFPTSENAVKAFTDLDGTIFQGRMLHLLPGEGKKNEIEITDDMPYAKKKELLKKQAAGSSHNWNALFVGANSVADIMSEKYQTTKSDILLKAGKQSVGVRVALGETQIVSEIRQFLLDNNVVLDSFSQAAGARSKTVMLVKHLPAGTTDEEIRAVFDRFGSIARLVLPPNGLTAIVEFYEPMEAKAAFTTLAYTKFKHVPLYLEWAPVDIFTTVATPKASAEATKEEPKEEDKSNISINKKSSDVDSGNEEDQDDADDAQVEPGSTLFVKNLNFSTTEETLRKTFSKYGKIREVSISKKKDSSNKGTLLSMGYGFVGYRAAACAQEALKHLQNSELEGHRLELKVSNRTTLQQHSGKKLQDSKQQQSTKILVRNIPFEAEISEIRQLFSVFGELKSIRVPKKLRGNHRGFGFVDFLTKGDAKRAFNALCHSTHLYGRRLVLEWAEEEQVGEDAVETLRKKTSNKYSEDGSVAKRKKSAVLDGLKS